MLGVLGNSARRIMLLPPHRRRRGGFHGVQRRLFFIVTAVVSAICALSLGALQFTMYTYNRQLYDASARLLSLSSSSIENELRKIEQISQVILADPNVQGHLRTVKNAPSGYEGFQARSLMNEILITHALSEQYIRSINIIDTKGNQTPVGIDACIVSEERIREILDRALVWQGKNTWIEPWEKDNSVVAARIVRQIADLTLEYLGLLAIRINMRELVDLFASSYPADTMSLHIFADGKKIFSTAGPGLEWSEIAGQAAGNTYGVRTIDGQKYLVTYTRPKYSGWTYVHLLPYDTVHRRTQLIRTLVILLYVAVLIIALSVALRFVRSTTRELLLKDTQYKALQAQINPHFLHNTLDSINWMARMAGQNQISHMVETLGSLLRKSVNSSQPVVSIREELEILQNYLTIQKIRYEDRLDVQVNVQESILDYAIPKLTLQPIVENTINHALDKMMTVCRVTITSEEDRNGIKIHIQDNGPGMTQDHLSKVRKGKAKTNGFGIGLKNIDERLKALFGEQYGLSIWSEPEKGTKVTIFLPKDRET